MTGVPTGRCVREDDGFHQHVYQAWVPRGPEDALRWATIVRDDLHSWTAEHMAEHPDAPSVYAHIRAYPAWIPLGEFATVEAAWTGLRAVGDIPVITCHQDAKEA